MLAGVKAGKMLSTVEIGMQGLLLQTCFPQRCSADTCVERNVKLVSPIEITISQCAEVNQSHLLVPFGIRSLRDGETPLSD